ncbi:MAG: serine acetyltransferase [Allobaculum sp.]
MAFRTTVLTWSKGDLMETYWKVFFKRQNATAGWKIDLMTILLNRWAHRHGGYIGKGAYFEGRPRLPHGLHGIFISRYAHIGRECWIYQNVTIGEANSKAPTIGDHVLIGANACLIGDIHIGDGARIGAGAVVRHDVPANATVTSGECQMVLHDSYRPFDLALALEKEEAEAKKR